MALTFKYEILMFCKRTEEFVATCFDTDFTSWEACQTESLEKLMDWDFPDHFGHPYLRYTSYRNGTKIKSIVYCPGNCSNNHYG